MALIFMDGFDRHGVGGITSSLAQSAILSVWNSWSTAQGTAPGAASALAIGVGLSATGSCGLIGSGSAGVASLLFKSLPSSINRIIGGIRYSLSGGQGGLSFHDGAASSTSAQCAILHNLLGKIEFRAGGNSSGFPGTILQTSTIAIGYNQTHCLEWDITIHNTAGSYAVYLDGALILSGSGVNTRGGTTNNSVNNVGVGMASGSSQTFSVDDVYFFDATGSRNNAPLLTNPRIEWQLPTSDVQKQWSTGPGVLGTSNIKTTTTVSIAANQILVRPFTPAVNCTLDSVGIICTTTNVTARFKAVVYADNSNTPAGGARLAVGTEVTGVTAATVQTLPISGGLSLTAGTKYWIGYIEDTTLTMSCNDNNGDAIRTTNTYTSGAPATHPAITASGVASAVIFGILSGISVNWPQVADPGGNGDYSYNFESTVNDEDLFGFPSLSTSPNAVHAMQVVASIKKSDGGARTVDLRAKSNTTTGSGTNTGIAPSTSFVWFASIFETNPDTGLPWTGSELNAGSAGIKIAS